MQSPVASAGCSGAAWRRLRVALWLIAGLLPAWVVAQDDAGYEVERLRAGTQDLRSLDNPTQILRQLPPAKPTHQLAVGDRLPPGTQLTTGEGVRVDLVSADRKLHVAVQARSRLTLVARGQVAVDDGSALFRLLKPLDYFFGVSGFQKVFAIARGTTFTVRAEPLCTRAGQPAGAPCVLIDLAEGALEVETRPPVRVAEPSARPAGPEDRWRHCEPGADDGLATLRLVEPLHAGEQRVVSLDPERFALAFATWAEAAAHFRAELAAARAGGDPDARLRALRNLGVVLRLGDQDAEALDIAEQGLALARARRDRPWEFRFLTDAGFAQWRARHDRQSLRRLEQALAMTDILADAGADLDVATLYGRLGILLFNARDRARPRPDIDAAEAYLRRGLALRAANGSDRGTLDLARSHFDLGVVLRIGRQDNTGAATELEQALALRQAAVGGCQDVFSAQVLVELALAEEELGYAALGDPPHGRPGPPFDAARRHFDDSFAMFERLYPEGGNASVAKAARRAADFHRELAEVWAKLGDAATASAERSRALLRYDQALAVLDSPAPPLQGERSRALTGRGHARLDAGDAAGANTDLQRALTLMQALRCQGAPDAQGDDAVRTVLGLLQRAATRAGDADQAARWQAQAARPAPGPSCAEAAR